MANAPTFDYEVQAQNIARRRNVLDALQAMSTQPIPQQSVGGMAAPTSWADVLAKMVQGYAGMKGQKKLDQEANELSTRYANDAKAGLENFYRTLEGQQYYSGVLKPDAQGNAQQVTVPGDRRRAILEAMASNHPLLQNLGQTLLTEDMKGQLTPKDLMSLATPESVLRAPSNPGDWVSKLDLKEMTPGNVMLNNGRVYTPPGDPGFTTETINGDLYQRSASGLRKLDNAPQVNVSTAQSPQDKFSSTFAEAEARRLSELNGMRPQMIDAVNATTKGLDLLNQGIHTGITANVAKNLESLNAALFNQDASKAARTQEFIAYIGDIVIPGLKAFGGSDTVEEMKYLQAVSGGDVTLEADTLANVLKSVEEKTRRKLGELDTALEAARQGMPGVPTLQGLSPVPAVTHIAGDSPEHPLTLDDLREMYPQWFFQQGAQ